MKKFNIQTNIGRAKYVVNHYDGIKKNRDGSEAWDIAIFKNKKLMRAFINRLKSDGYVEN